MTVQNQSLGQTFGAPLSVTRIDVLKAAFSAFLFGGVLVYAMGFAHPGFLHNAAHDWRHSMNFPCH